MLRHNNDHCAPLSRDYFVSVLSRDFLGPIGRRLSALLLLGVLVEPPHVAAQRVLVPKHLEAELAGDVARLGAVHVPDVSGQGVPRQLLKAERASLLLTGAARSGRTRVAGSRRRKSGIVVLVRERAWAHSYEGTRSQKKQKEIKQKIAKRKEVKKVKR